VDQAFRLLGLISDPGGPEVSMRRIHPQDKSRLKKGVAESLLRDVPLDVTFRSIQADGTVRHLRACAQVERNTGGRPERIVGTVLDVTEFKRAEAQAWQAASIDSLTGAFARSRFFELAAHEFERWRRYRHPLAVMMIDVDDFKQFNDAFGHGFGDRVLQAVVKAIKTQLRRSDILGRYGGDEFAVALPDSTLQAARETAERLRRAVNGLRLPVSGDGDDARISISIGVAESDSDECTNIEHVLKRADRALYAAKHAGRNQVVNA
jgi:diguanylate cyclase (GGDEF)-like protein